MFNIDKRFALFLAAENFKNKKELKIIETPKIKSLMQV